MSEIGGEEKAIKGQTDVLREISTTVEEMKKSSSYMFWASVLYFTASIVIAVIALVQFVIFREKCAKTY